MAKGNAAAVLASHRFPRQWDKTWVLPKVKTEVAPELGPTMYPIKCSYQLTYYYTPHLGNTDGEDGTFEKTLSIFVPPIAE